jgi:hypothetical protein
MIFIQEFKGNQIQVEQFINTHGIRLGWKVLSIQKKCSWYFFGHDSWIVTYEKGII